MVARLLPLAVLLVQSNVQGTAAYSNVAETVVGQVTDPDKLIQDPNKYITLKPSEAPAVTVGDCPQQCLVLFDRALGWADGCLGLERIQNATEYECQEGCCDDWRCEVWQFAQDGCWRGRATRCNIERSDKMIGSGQQIQHGNVRVVNPTVTGKIYKDLEFQGFAHGTPPEKQGKCQRLCYSDSYCILWQSDRFGNCWYGPRKREDGTRFDVEIDEYYGGEPMVVGELIEHFCAATPPPFAPDYVPWYDTNRIYTIAAIVGAVVVALIIVATMFAIASKQPKTRGLKDDEDEDEEEREEDGKYYPHPLASSDEESTQ